MSTRRTNRNAAGKIERAYRLGWHRDVKLGPCRFVRLGVDGRRAELLAVANRVDRRWRPSPTHRDTEEVAA